MAMIESASFGSCYAIILLNDKKLINIPTSLRWIAIQIRKARFDSFT